MTTSKDDCRHRLHINAPGRALSVARPESAAEPGCGEGPDPGFRMEVAGEEAEEATLQNHFQRGRSTGTFQNSLGTRKKVSILR